MGVLLIYVAAVALIALAMLCWAWRGKVVDGHPLCRKCGFDLTGKPDTSTQCPECGCDLSSARAIRHGHRRRRHGWLVISGICLLMLGLMTGTASYYALSQKSFYSRLPTPLLTYLARNNDEKAMNQLFARLALRQATPQQLDGLVDWILARQADRELSWQPAWGNLIEMMQISNLLTAERWNRYVGQIYEPEFDLRRTHVLGDEVSLFLSGKCRCGRIVGMTGNVTPQFFLDGETPQDAPPSNGTLVFMQPSFPLNPHLVVAPKENFSAQLQPFVGQRVNVHVRLTVELKPRTVQTTGVTLTRERVIAVNVLPTGTTAQPGSAQPIRDPAVAHAVRNAITNIAINARPTYVGQAEREEYFVDLHRPAPADLAFELLVLVDGKPVRLLPMMLAKSAEGPMQAFFSPNSDRPQDSTDLPDEVTVILKPSAAVARATLNMTEYADVELRFDHVRVNKVGARRPATTRNSR